MNATATTGRGSHAASTAARYILMLLGLAGTISYFAAIAVLYPYQLQIVSHEIVRTPPSQAGGIYFPSLIFAIAIGCGLVVLAWRNSTASRHQRFVTTAACLAPLALCVPTVLYGLADAAPPYGLTLLIVIACAWAGYYACRPSPVGIADDERANATPADTRRRYWPIAIILAAIIVLTVIHALLELNFYNHFMLGHADFGHFTEEFKNCLAGRGLRSDSFDNTRLGWHFVPLLYALVPGYWLWPSPVYVMVLGPLFVHLPAMPAYYFARKRSGSITVGLLMAFAWLLLPSLSRLVYSSTYGFQWIYAAMPLLAIMAAAGAANRMKTAVVMVVLILLCKETTTAATLGFGIYLALFTRRRLTGITIALVSVAYLILCTNLLIPHFAVSGRYDRIDQYGELGHSVTQVLSAAFTNPALFFARLTRVQSVYFILMLLIPMALLPLRGWRLAIAALPTLVLILLLKGNDWLSIKFWHQATVLPLLFFAGIASMGSENKRTKGYACAALFAAAAAHYLYAFSPISKSYEPYEHTAALHQPDPRLEFVRDFRARVSHDKSILATERMAAHFTDYKHIYTGKRIRPADYVIVDRSDAWDQQSDGLLTHLNEIANDPAYELESEYGPILIFRSRTPIPSGVADDF